MFFFNTFWDSVSVAWGHGPDLGRDHGRASCGGPIILKSKENTMCFLRLSINKARKTQFFFNVFENWP